MAEKAQEAPRIHEHYPGGHNHRGNCLRSLELPMEVEHMVE